MSDEKIINKLITFNEHLDLANLLNAPFRLIGWGIISLLAMCVDALSNGLKEIYSLMNFFNSVKIQEFITSYMPIIFGLAALALGWLGWKVIIKKETDLNKAVTNGLIAVTLFIVLPWAMVQGEKLVSSGIDTFEEGDMTTSTKVIKSNITDVYLLDQAEWSTLSPDPKNYISGKKDIGLLNITETVDTGGFWSSSPLSDDGVDILTQKVNDASGEYKLEDLESNFLTDDEAYYRYSWHPIYMIVELLTLTLVFVFTAIKTAQLIIELGLLKVFAQGTALTDIENGQRNKKLMEKIRNTFIVLYSIMLILNIYLIFIDFVTTSGVSKPVQLVVIVAAGIFVIDGPNFIEELFGIDAGLKSASRGLMGMFAGARTAQMATNAVGKGMKNVGKMAKATGKALGKTGLKGVQGGAAIKGALDGFKENRQSNAPGNNSENKNQNSSPLNSNSGSGNDGNSPSPIADMGNSTASETPGGSSTMPTSGGETPVGSSAMPASGGETPISSMGDTPSKPLAAMNKPFPNKPGTTPLNRSTKPKENVNQPKNVNIPSFATAASNDLKSAMQPKPSTTDTFSGSLLQNYADKAESIHNSKPVQSIRKSYDMGKNSVLKNNKDNKGN